MDDLPHWTLGYIKELLPPDLLSATSPLTHLLTTLTALLTSLATPLLPLASALLDKLTTLLTDSPAVVAGTVLVVLAIVALQILSLVRRVLLFWTRLAFRLLTWAAAALLLAAVWQRGVERSVRDAVVLVTQVGGWVVGAGTVWWREYERMQQQQQQQQGQGQQAQGGGYQHGR